MSGRNGNRDRAVSGEYDRGGHREGLRDLIREARDEAIERLNDGQIGFEGLRRAGEFRLWFGFSVGRVPTVPAVGASPLSSANQAVAFGATHPSRSLVGPVGVRGRVFRAVPGGGRGEDHGEFRALRPGPGQAGRREGPRPKTDGCRPHDSLILDGLR